MSRKERKKLLYKLRVLESLVIMDEDIKDHMFYCAMINDISRNVKRSH